ncbi:PIG-L family deacetylase [Streptomyces beijiangensis]|uniref:PIG-L family deacetylase n=1 Tax=Streptomyces beijiangensis TaxID=163361 RepID=A0A939F2E2_9ACTN|nr:PIG-L family deacetylase [Streptomyces beijiangensis]MBO0510862.1 PIG-L family deacetylase [Streptomyces beijiangensis]
MTSFRRRGPIAILLVAIAAGTAAVVGTEAATSSAPTVTVNGPIVQPVRTVRQSVMQILAHEDDDLYFMNPDVSQAIASHSSVTSVYLTAGEADGINMAGGRGARNHPPADKAKYAEARQNGIRAAYAEMATGNRSSPWQRTTMPTAGGGTAELDVLKARPQLSLVWVQLHEAGSVAGYRPHSLHGLWDGTVQTLGSQLSAGTPVERRFSYTRAEVVSTIAGLLERFQPTSVRLLDPTPGRNEKTGNLLDHQDHMYAARFAQAALAHYATSKNHPHFTVQNYLGYFTGRLGHSLDPANAAAKLRTVETYAWKDHADNYCKSASGCGDRKVAAHPSGHDWTQSIRYTRGESTSWMQPGADGSLSAFGVLDQRLAVWHRSPGAAGTWSEPELKPGAGIDPGVSTVKLPDGRIAVFGTRTTIGSTAADYRRDVVLTVQKTPGGRFGDWQSLGSPELADHFGTSDISAPAVAVGRDGRLTVYLRNSAFGLSARTQQADGDWAKWHSIGGKGLHGDPAVATDKSGRRFVFAATPRSVAVWTQQAPGAALKGPVPTGLPTTTLPLTARADDEGVRLYFRKTDSGNVRTALVTAGATPTVSPVTEAGGAAGFGPVSTTGKALAARTGSGHLGTAPFPKLSASSPSSQLRSSRGDPIEQGKPHSTDIWTQDSYLFAGAPALVTDSAGTASVAAIGLDGKLHWNRVH